MAIVTLTNAAEVLGLEAYAKFFESSRAWSLIEQLLHMMPLAEEARTRFSRPGATAYRVNRLGLAAVDCLASLLVKPPSGTAECIEEREGDAPGSGEPQAEARRDDSDCFCMEPLQEDEEPWCCVVCHKRLHRHCAEQWFERSCFCPYCRSPDPAFGLSELPQAVERLLRTLESHPGVRNDSKVSMKVALLIAHTAAAEKNRHPDLFDSERGTRILNRIGRCGCFKRVGFALRDAFDGRAAQGMPVWRLAVGIGQLAALPGAASHEELGDLVHALSRAVVKAAPDLGPEERSWCFAAVRQLVGSVAERTIMLLNALRDPSEFGYEEIVEAEALLCLLGVVR